MPYRCPACSCPRTPRGARSRKISPRRTEGFHQPRHATLLCTIIAIEAQPFGFSRKITASTSSSQLDDCFSHGLRLATTRPRQGSQRFLSLFIQPDRNRLLHREIVSQLYDRQMPRDLPPRTPPARRRPRHVDNTNPR